MEFIQYQTQGFTGILTINRPAVLNALNSQVLDELAQAVDAIDTKVIRCVILTGAGEKAFVAGADIAEMQNMDPAQAKAFSEKGNAVFRKIEKLAVPVICAVNGFALGGGCELSLACDIRIAAENAAFGQPEVGLGITPGFGGTQRLARTIGLSAAKELIYTGKKVKAPQALALGLVSQVVPQAELLDTAKALADAIAKNVPMAIRASKAAINEGMQVDIDAALAIEAQRFSECFVTEDRKNAMSAFVEKRKPEPFQNK